MKLERLDSANLAPYLPIKNAAWNMTGIALLLASTALAWWWYFYCGVDTLPAKGVTLVCALAACLPTVGIVPLVWKILWDHPESDGSVFKWTRDFVDRNVYGYWLWCCVDATGTVSYELLSIKNEIHIHKPSVEPLFAIGVATNGRRPCLARYATGTFPIPLSRARMVGLFPEKNVLYLRLGDHNGDALTLDARNLLSLIHKGCLDPGRFVSDLGTHFDLVRSLIDRDRMLDETREILQAERLERDKAVGDIEEAVALIDATKRFVRSREGGAVREWLADKLGFHLTFRDIPRKKRDAA